MFMEGKAQETPPLPFPSPPTNPPFLFEHSHLPSSSTLHPPPDSSLIIPNTSQPQVFLPDNIHDLVGLFPNTAPNPSGISPNNVYNNNDQMIMPLLETAPLTISNNVVVRSPEELAIKDKISRGASANTSSKNRKNTVPKVVFHTRSPDDVLDDGYRWRKYGQKSVKNSKCPRLASPVSRNT